MTGKIILCDNKKSANNLSRIILLDECKKNGTTPSKEEQMFAVYENLLTGQFGLFVPNELLSQIDDKYFKNSCFKTPLWVDESFINGEPFSIIGYGEPFIIMGDNLPKPKNVYPYLNRKFLGRNLPVSLVEDARKTTRKYTLEIQNGAQKIINQYISKPEVRKKIIETINPYQFEELIAELLLEKGFDVFLTPRSADGGKDIIAAYSLHGKPIVMMVECKRRPIDSTLGPVEFRALVGQFYIDNIDTTKIDYAMLVTTAGKIGNSSITMNEKLKNASIVEFDTLNKWLLNYGQVRNGLWLPEAFDKAIQ